MIDWLPLAPLSFKAQCPGFIFVDDRRSLPDLLAGRQETKSQRKEVG